MGEIISSKSNEGDVNGNKQEYDIEEITWTDSIRSEKVVSPSYSETDSPLTQRDIVFDLGKKMADGKQESQDLQNKMNLSEESRSFVRNGLNKQDGNNIRNEVNDAHVKVSTAKNTEGMSEQKHGMTNGDAVSPPMVMDITTIRMHPLVMPCEMFGTTPNVKHSELYRYSHALTRQIQELKESHAYVNKMEKEIEKLKEEKHELEQKLEVLQEFIDEKDKENQRLLFKIQAVQEQQKKGIDRITKLMEGLYGLKL